MKVRTSGDRLWGLSGAERPCLADGVKARLEQFLVAGTEAALGGVPAGVDGPEMEKGLRVV